MQRYVRLDAAIVPTQIIVLPVIGLNDHSIAAFRGPIPLGHEPETLDGAPIRALPVARHNDLFDDSLLYQFAYPALEEPAVRFGWIGETLLGVSLRRE